MARTALLSALAALALIGVSQLAEYLAQLTARL